MKKFTLILMIFLVLSSCGEQKEHHFIVVYNNYKDTTEVAAKYWRTYQDDWTLPDGVKSVTEFTSDYGKSLIYNVDCIIAKDSINNK